MTLERFDIARILLVDDEPAFRLLAERFLSQQGHQVVSVADLTAARMQLAAQSFDLMLLDLSLPPAFDADIITASNGLEALTILRSREIGLVFLDLTMPELDGVGVLEVIKADALDCLVIVVSADIQPEMQKRVMELGALAFVQKPASADKLADVMHKYGLI